MKNDIKQLIKIANLQNSKLKTVIKARDKLISLIKDAFDAIHELIEVNIKIAKTKNILDNETYDTWCDTSKELFDKIKQMHILKDTSLLTNLLDNQDSKLAELADDLLDIIDENKEHIVARPNPLKGYKASSIPL
jgi:uncharacterized protein (DUF927 family)